MFEVTPKFLATLKATPTADLRRIRDTATDYLERPDGPALIAAHMIKKGATHFTEERAVSSTNQVIAEIDKVMRSRGCR